MDLFDALNLISLQSPMSHNTSGCCATSENVQSLQLKIPPKVSSPPCTASPNYNQGGYAWCFQTYLVR
jgi:hypothetical protein